MQPVSVVEHIHTPIVGPRIQAVSQVVLPIAALTVGLVVKTVIRPHCCA